MGNILPDRVAELFERGLSGTTTTDQGRALEDLACYLFEATPSISIAERNALNIFRTEEIDVAFWNDQHRRGFRFLPNVLLVECKNWARPVGGAEVAYFVRRLQNRGLNFGFLIAPRG
jgi:hypothetical protein